MARYNICDQTPEAAEAHTRRVYNVPSHVGLGWKPYRYTVTRGAIAHCAFHDTRSFEAWLSRVYGKPIEWTDRGDGLKTAHFEVD